MITRKGGKVVTIPLAPRTARTIDLAIGERTDGPVFLATDGRRLDRHGAGRVVGKTARRAGLAKTVTPHTLRHAFVTAALDAGSRCATCKRLCLPVAGRQTQPALLTIQLVLVGDAQRSQGKREPPICGAS
jgi:integrase